MEPKIQPKYKNSLVTDNQIVMPLVYKYKVVDKIYDNNFSLAEEIIRCNYIQGLIKLFYTEFNKLPFAKNINKGKILKNHKLSEIVQRWCWFQQKNPLVKDIIIPYIPDESYDNVMLLGDINFILEINKTKNFIRNMIKSVHMYLEDAYNAFIKLSDNVFAIIINKKQYSDCISFTISSKDNDIFDNLSFIKKDIVININNKLYSRLCNKLKKFSGNVDNSDEYIVGLLLRYMHLDSKNQQLAIPENVKELFSNIGVDFELFGSAINVINNYYCSLYYDIERYFGSQGDFFNMKIKQGIYWCNPPYINITMKNVALALINFLKNCKNVAFIVTIPIWDNYTKNKILQDKITTIIKNSNIHVNQDEFIDYDIYYLLHPYIKSELLIPKSIMPFTNYRLDKIIYPINTYMILLYSKNMNKVYLDNLIIAFNKIELIYKDKN